MIKSQTKLIEAGTLVPYRVFTEEPSYEGHEMDRKVNNDGSLGESMGRYSQSKLGLPAKALELNRTFVTIETKAPVNNTPIKIDAEA
jgi:hypothetical protein